MNSFNHEHEAETFLSGLSSTDLTHILNVCWRKLPQKSLMLQATMARLAEHPETEHAVVDYVFLKRSREQGIGHFVQRLNNEQLAELLGHIWERLPDKSLIQALGNLLHDDPQTHTQTIAWLKAKGKATDVLGSDPLPNHMDGVSKVETQ
jgi:hypothetical protein